MPGSLRFSFSLSSMFCLHFFLVKALYIYGHLNDQWLRILPSCWAKDYLVAMSSTRQLSMVWWSAAFYLLWICHFLHSFNTHLFSCTEKELKILTSPRSTFPFSANFSCAFFFPSFMMILFLLFTHSQKEPVVHGIITGFKVPCSITCLLKGAWCSISLSGMCFTW